jgi:hypothetical protein
MSGPRPGALRIEGAQKGTVAHGVHTAVSNWALLLLAVAARYAGLLAWHCWAELGLG